MSLGAEVRLSRSSRKHIGSVDPYALKIPAPKGAEYSLTESDPSPFHAEPEHRDTPTISYDVFMLTKQRPPLGQWIVWR